LRGKRRRCDVELDNAVAILSDWDENHHALLQVRFTEYFCYSILKGLYSKLHIYYRQIYIEHSSGSPKFSSFVLNAVVLELCAAEILTLMFSHLLKDTDIAASNRIGYLDVLVDTDSIMVMVGLVRGP